MFSDAYTEGGVLIFGITMRLSCKKTKGADPTDVPVVDFLDALEHEEACLKKADALVEQAAEYHDLAQSRLNELMRKVNSTTENCRTVFQRIKLAAACGYRPLQWVESPDRPEISLQPVQKTTVGTGFPAALNAKASKLTPRVRTTLQRMLAGDSEKEIGVRLQISKHTVHVYVKHLFRHFDVNSRGELLALFVDPKYRAMQPTPHSSPASHSDVRFSDDDSGAEIASEQTAP